MDIEASATLVDLTGKVAVVTGAGLGMGRATARRLADAGATVVAADLDIARAKAVADEIGGHAYEIDVSDTAAVTALTTHVVREHGGLDIWVNNAGIYPLRPLFEVEDADFQRMMDVNLKAVYFATREAARQMIGTGRGGVVVNVSSIAAYRAGSPGLAHYAASKAGVVTLTKTLASALGPHGVRVVGIAPGVVDTDGMKAVEDQFEASGVNAADRGSEIPLGRNGEPDDIARVALFLSSPLARFVTGVTIPVDGGDLTSGKATVSSAGALGL